MLICSPGRQVGGSLTQHGLAKICLAKIRASQVRLEQRGFRQA